MLVLAEQNRTFGYAAAASVALHAAVLLMNTPTMRQPAAPPPEPPLVAHLVEPAPPAPPPMPVVEEESPPANPAPPKPVARAKPKPKPVPRARAPIPAAPPVPAPTPAPVTEEPVLPETVEQAAPPAPSPAPPPVAAIAPPAAAPVPDPATALARFRQQLVDVAVRYKRYPRVALDNGWTGDVVVHIEVAASGAVASVRLKTSSGFDVLDQQALEMFRKAAPEVVVPPALRGKDFSVEVRAIYNLQDRPG